MRHHRNPLNRRTSIFFLLVLAWSLCSSGCASFNALVNHFNSLDHFEPLHNDQRILYEPGAALFAQQVAIHLPAAITTVEARQFALFPSDIRIYVCKSPDSFKKLTGKNVSAMAYRNSIFLSPEILDQPETQQLYITHELSHLHLLLHTGGYGYISIPSWFAEGLATYISGGGGAQKVSAVEAEQAIGSGNHFMPIEKAGLGDMFVSKNANYWGIKHRYKHHMFCHQSMMYVAFLEQESPDGFKSFLTALENRTAFPEAFRSSFGTNSLTMWDTFKSRILHSVGPPI